MKSGMTIAILTTLCLAPALMAATLHVPADYGDIAAALADAAADDTVMVAAGVYDGPTNRNLDFDGKRLVLLSESGPESTTIDCEGLGYGVWVGEGADGSVVNGFRIINGTGGNGAGLIVSHTTATIEHCIFHDNHADYNAGGVYVGYSTDTVTISDCLFFDNTGMFRASGLMADHSTVEIDNSIFYGNTTGDTGGGAIHCNSATLTMTNSTLAGNGATDWGGTLQVWASTATVSNSIFAGTTEGAAVYDGTYYHCISYGNAGGDDLNGSSDCLVVDPKFCDAGGDDYTLCADSPAAPGSADNVWGEQVGALGVGCPECPFVMDEAMSWGEVKGAYR